MASHLGLSLETCMNETSHKHFLVWQEYLRRQWNKPNRSDHYLMAIAQEVRRVLSKSPSSIKLSQFKIKWTWSKAKEGIKTAKQKIGSSQSFWCMLTGVTPPKKDDDD